MNDEIGVNNCKYCSFSYKDIENGFVVKCALNSDRRYGQIIRQVYESIYPQKHGLINGECQFVAMGEMCKCPFYQEKLLCQI